MKRWQKVLLIIVACYISFYFVNYILGFTSLSNQSVSEISLVFFLLSIPIYFLIKSGIVNKENKENKEIIKYSLKVQKLIELNNAFNFKEILEKNRSIVEREYSRKSLDRVTATSIIKYHIENDINSIRTDIENSLYNIELLDSYDKALELISNYESANNSKYSYKKFKRIENRVFNNLVHKKDDFFISLKLEAYYLSNGGRVYDSRHGKRSFDELLDIYNEWKNGNMYEETIRQERKIMNDDIRFNVLKRDNYTCQICGATSKDGAKLHVDHIIPVSKGGKTIMSNLQTLCERCNLGKSNKTDEEIDDSMICPKCGSKLVERNGKYGKFIGCSNYPRCRYNKKSKRLYD